MIFFPFSYTCMHVAGQLSAASVLRFTSSISLSSFSPTFFEPFKWEKPSSAISQNSGHALTQFSHAMHNGLTISTLNFATPFTSEINFEQFSYCVLANIDPRCSSGDIDYAKRIQDLLLSGAVVNCAFHL